MQNPVGFVVTQKELQPMRPDTAAADNKEQQ